MNAFGKLGDQAKLIKQAMALKKALESEVIVLEESGVKIAISGDQKIKELVVNGMTNAVLIDVLNRALKKSQEVAARKMQEMAGGMGGLMGRQQ